MIPLTYFHGLLQGKCLSCGVDPESTKCGNVKFRQCIESVMRPIYLKIRKVAHCLGALNPEHCTNAWNISQLQRQAYQPYYWFDKFSKLYILTCFKYVVMVNTQSKALSFFFKRKTPHISPEVLAWWPRSTHTCRLWMVALQGLFPRCRFGLVSGG